jgi:hypothetical protein
MLPSKNNKMSLVQVSSCGEEWLLLDLKREGGMIELSSINRVSLVQVSSCGKE